MITLLGNHPGSVINYELAWFMWPVPRFKITGREMSNLEPPK